MSPKQPAKQKRAQQNRNQRAARAARAANANAAPRSTSSPGASSSAAGGGSLLSRLRGGGSTGTRPSTGASARAAAMRGAQPPGYRAALSAVLAAGAALLLCAFALRYPVDGSGDLYTKEHLAADWSVTALRAAAEQPEASAAEIADSITEWAPDRGKETVILALWPFSLAVALPLIGAGIGFHAVRRRASSKVVNRALYATLFGAVLTQGLLLLFLPVVIALGVAMFQVRKAEAMAAASSADGGVIDVDEVEDDEVDLHEDAEGDEIDAIEAEAIEADATDAEVIEAVEAIDVDVADTGDATDASHAGVVDVDGSDQARS